MTHSHPFIRRRDFLLGSAAAASPALALAAPPMGPFPLLFMDRKDVHNVWGQIRFGVTSFSKVSDSGAKFTVKYCRRRQDGGYDVWAFDGGDYKPWKLYRARTGDGIRFEDVRVILERKEGEKWAHTCSVSYSPELGRFLFLKNRNTPDGFSIYAFTSADGDRWQEYEHNPVFEEGDRWGAIWSPAVRQFVYYGKGIQRNDKRIPELFANARRVVTVRTSPDGFHWTPDTPSLYRRDVIAPEGKHGGARIIRGPLVPVENQISPDESDPPDMEFYAGDAFLYHGRYYMLMLNYAASAVPFGTPPVGADGHGPALDTEWWISRNGLDWDRPFRGMDAGEMFISHNPMSFGGQLLFHSSDGVWAIPEERITYVTARANAVFDTAQFPAPGRPLRVNARVPGTGYSNFQNQGYLMAELIDDRDQPVPGYEKERCLFQGPLDRRDAPLRWNGRDGSELRGKSVRVRLHIRAADVFAVGTQEDVL